MFTELYPLAAGTRLAMLVTADAERGLMTISVMPRPIHNDAATLTTDLTLTATPEEFDNGFVAALTGYRAELAPMLEQAAAAKRTLQTEKAKLQEQAKTTQKPASSAKRATTPAPRCADVDDGEEVGDATNPNDDPDLGWIKNRQPQLF
ncbi:hypothetical protein ASD15_14250 [Massilia sp. Root351]|jgi:PRTRC genetic system protein E|nr:hypothetical protein ASD15_14250 [Massilia sp. Root351]